MRGSGTCGPPRTTRKRKRPNPEREILQRPLSGRADPGSGPARGKEKEATADLAVLLGAALSGQSKRPRWRSTLCPCVADMRSSPNDVIAFLQHTHVASGKDMSCNNARAHRRPYACLRPLHGQQFKRKPRPKWFGVNSVRPRTAACSCHQAAPKMA
eukprot:2927561-Alexandrium_andersonii.AAC.2